MDIENAKKIQSWVIGLLMAREGIGEFNDDDITGLKATPLTDMLMANELMKDHKELLQDGGYRSYVVTTEVSIAELYCRLHNNGFQTTGDLEDACSAMNEMHQTTNGHAVLVDGYGNWSFIELNHDGDGAIETLVESASACHLLWKVKSMLEKLDVVS